MQTYKPQKVCCIRCGPEALENRNVFKAFNKSRSAHFAPVLQTSSSCKSLQQSPALPRTSSLTSSAKSQQVRIMPRTFNGCFESVLIQTTGCQVDWIYSLRNFSSVYGPYANRNQVLEQKPCPGLIHSPFFLME